MVTTWGGGGRARSPMRLAQTCVLECWAHRETRHMIRVCPPFAPSASDLKVPLHETFMFSHACFRRQAPR
jgi:hypothetical protein